MNNSQERSQKKLRRILTLIEVVAPLRMPFTIQDAIYLMESKAGGIGVCNRTIKRDIELLIAMNYIYVHRKGSFGENILAHNPTQYKSNMRTISIPMEQL